MVDLTENNRVTEEEVRAAESSDTNNDNTETKNCGIDITPNQDGGVLKEILRVGDSDEGPATGDVVSVHYVGTLESDGTKFDSSRDRGECFEFNLGKGEVIKAWDIGVATMKKGELCKLTCRGDYAYGKTGSPPNIPPNATLIFEIELFSWQEEDLSHKKDGGIRRRILKAGEGFARPNDGALVEIDLVGSVNNTVFDQRESLKFIIGEGPDHNIPEGLERALEKFKSGEQSRITLTPKYTFGSAGNSELGIPPNSDVQYTITLKSFENAKESYELSQEEKVEQAAIFKAKGTNYFKREKYRQAVKYYKKIIDFLQYDSGLDDNKKEESRALKLAGHLNLAMCYLKLKDNTSAQNHAKDAIDLDVNNVKAYFRRGQALVNSSYPEEALQDFRKCLELDPENKAAKQQIQLCQKLIQKVREKEKQVYGGMFDKFARADARKSAALSDGNVMEGNLGQWPGDKKENDETKRDNNMIQRDEHGEEHDFSNLADIKMI